jgi:hypothetical protein
VKNQYFGDQNDYFKYNLLIYLAEELSGIRKLSIIWMLTKDDASGDGRRIKYSKGPGDRKLFRFLRESLDGGVRDVAIYRSHLFLPATSFRFFFSVCLDFLYCYSRTKMR